MPIRRDPRTIEFDGNARYRPVRRIGGGGMGVVYEALDTERNVRVAIKTMREPSPKSLLRFKHEFRALAELSHPNLVQLLELIEEKGQWFFTMELVEGIDFMHWVRPVVDLQAAPTSVDPVGETDRTDAATPPARTRTAAGGFDEAKVRTAFAQVAEGLAALHAAGQVHRDIKPSNVLVSDGRVVILDFGLVKEVVTNATHNSSVAGTIHYMAPEQAAGLRVGPPADWYSAGVMLYEALTRRLPYEDPMREVLLHNSGPPPSPRSLVADVPPDLDELCLELLAREPELRPGADEVVRRLQPGLGTRRAPLPLSRPSKFVGRADEKTFLDKVWQNVASEPKVVLIHGEPGIGKSALVRDFCDTLKREGAMVLQGRCLAREVVPFRAVDGIIDALSAHLGRMPADEAAALLPRHVAALAQIFPVLRRLDVVARAPASRLTNPDPQERRARAFSALRELFLRLSDRKPIVIAIENLQAADEDSLQLLSELLRAPEAPPLLLIATLRDHVDELAQRFPCEKLQLGRLSDEEARELAQTLAPEHADQLVAEAKGHPLFLVELARGAGTTLDEALKLRLTLLPRQARAVLELLAAAGAPLQHSLLARLSGLGDAEYAAASTALVRAQLAVETGSRPADTIELFHERHREPFLSELSEVMRQELHRVLARAMESRSSAAAVAAQWLAAGDKNRAAYWLVRAAAQSADGLAFQRAAELYRRAMELKPPEGDEGRAVLERLGDALQALGQCVEAAGAYVKASSLAGDPLEAIDLRRRAAEHLLRAGHLDDGTELLRAVLSDVGIRMPATRAGAAFGYMTRRMRLKLRGEVKTQAQPARDKLLRADVCGSAAVGMPVVDPLLGAYFQTRQMEAARAAGEPGVLCRALATEAVNQAAQGRPPKVRALLAEVDALAEKSARPESAAQAAQARGICHFLLGDFARGADESDRAVALYRDRCSGVGWELGNSQFFALLSRIYLGELSRVAGEWPDAARQASRRGDLHAAISLHTGHTALVWLARDDVERAKKDLEEAARLGARARWSTQHDYYDLFAHANIDLYEGRAKEARERLAAGWRGLKKSFLLRLQLVRVIMIELRARAALACGDRDAALRDARRLAAENAPWAQALGLLTSANTTATYTEAAARLDAAGLRLHAACARRRAGAADEIAVAAPDKFVALYCPAPVAG
jgi:eukaryotic-like serine/threonine-protein kinase